RISLVGRKPLEGVVWSIVVVVDGLSDFIIEIVAAGKLRAEKVVVLEYLVDGFDHAVGEEDIDAGDKLFDGRGSQEGFYNFVVVFAPAIDDEIDVVGNSIRDRGESRAEKLFRVE